MFIALFTRAKRSKEVQLKFILMDKWGNRMGYIHKMEHYSDLKGRKWYNPGHYNVEEP